MKIKKAVNQQIKGQLGFEDVQVRSQRVLMRYWIL